MPRVRFHEKQFPRGSFHGKLFPRGSFLWKLHERPCVNSIVYKFTLRRAAFHVVAILPLFFFSFRKQPSLGAFLVRMMRPFAFQNGSERSRTVLRPLPLRRIWVLRRRRLRCGKTATTGLLEDGDKGDLGLGATSVAVLHAAVTDVAKRDNTGSNTQYQDVVVDLPRQRCS